MKPVVRRLDAGSQIPADTPGDSSTPSVGAALLRAFLALTLAALVPAPASAGTGFLTGETECTGMNKTCIYDHLGSAYYVTARCVSICPVSIRISTTPSYTPAPAPIPDAPSYAPRYDTTGFFTGETPCDGMTKACYYNVQGEPFVRMQSCASVCPVSIRVRR